MHEYETRGARLFFISLWFSMLTPKKLFCYVIYSQAHIVMPRMHKYETRGARLFNILTFYSLTLIHQN